MKKRIFFRADGNSIIGFGHVVRSLALAEILKNDFRIFYAIQNPNQLMISFIESVTSDICCLPEENNYELDSVNFIQKLHSEDIIVTDGYHFDSRYQFRIKEIGCRLVCIDDLHSIHFFADAVINHAGGITNEEYSMESYTKLFLGIKYALLRKPFIIASRKLEIKQRHNIAFVCFGGSNVDLILSNLLRTLLKNKTINQIHVVSSFKSLNNKLAQENIYSTKISFHSNLSDDELCRLIQNCDIAFTSASTIAYECCAVGIPLYVGYFTANQTLLYNFLINSKMAFPLGDLSLADTTLNIDIDRTSGLYKNMQSAQHNQFNEDIELNLKSIFKNLN